MARGFARRLFWFVVLWAGGVITIAAVGLVIKTVLL